MKLPTEAELIDLENALTYHLANSWNSPVARTLETLIALARDPSQLLQNIPLDDALDRATFRTVPLRTSIFEPSPSARPKSPRRPAPKQSMVVQPKKKPKR